MHLIQYETPISEFDNFPRPWVFLAGPTVRGNQQHLTSWRGEALNLFHASGFKGTLISPEFADKTASDKGKDWIPLWEYNGLIKCDHILMWIPRTRELIGLTTNFEFGYWMARDRSKVTYGRPDDAYRIRYIDLMWNHDNTYYGGSSKSAKIFNTLSSTVAEVVSKLKA